MTKEEFTILYAKNSEMTVEEVLKEQVVLPCNCGDKLCKGWAVVYDSPLSIKAHNGLYNNEENKV